MNICALWNGTLWWRLKTCWQRAASFLRQERTRQWIKRALLILAFFLFPQLTILGLLGWLLYERHKEHSQGSSVSQKLKELEADNRRLCSEKWELETRVRAYERGDSREFIANLNKVYEAFDAEIARINANESMLPYAKAQRIKDWENLRDIQIGRLLEPQK